LIWGIREMNKRCFLSTSLICIFTAVALCGCSNDFWDPTQVGRFRPVPATNVILDSLGVAEETPPAWEVGEDPRPADVIAYDMDYVFGPGDIVQISIFELFNEGQMFANQYIITETGKLSIPDVGVVEAAGLTESQLEEELVQILSPNVIKEPSVNVIMTNSQSRVFSILGGGVPRPSRYGIPRYDYRLTDALATAGGIGQFNISYVYVSRPITGEEAAESLDSALDSSDEADLFAPDRSIDPSNELMEILAPLSLDGWPGSEASVISAAELATERDLAEAALPDSLWPGKVSGRRDNSVESVLNRPAELFSTDQDSSDAVSSAGRIEWVFRDGKWVPIEVGKSAPAGGAADSGAGEVSGPISERVPEGYGLDVIGQAGSQRRVIRIPADKLLSGDPRYNIVIKPGDNIHVPVDIIGEFCIMGNINRTGFYNLTGRPMTLKMAIAAAGGLGPLAWPKRCEVVRRIGKKREEIVMVDLDKIARGEQPDFFIKPNDLINVGTHSTARWRAVLRNAFRATYGFGFIYDRNFADRDYGTSRPLPGWF